MAGAGGSIAVAKLRAFVERIERVEEDIKALNADKSDIYKEVRGEGFDVKAVRAVVAKRKLDDADRQERDAIFDLYWAALSGASRVHVHEGDEFPVSVVGTCQPDDAAHTAPVGSAHTEIPAPIPQPVPSLATDQTGEEVPSASPVALSDDDVPAFLKDKQDCRKLANGSCKIKFHTSALCSECETARVNARAMA